MSSVIVVGEQPPLCELDEIEDYDKYKGTIERILDETEGIDDIIKRLKLVLGMIHRTTDEGQTDWFISMDTEIVLVLDSCDGYHIYTKEDRGQY